MIRRRAAGLVLGLALLTAPGEGASPPRSAVRLPPAEMEARIAAEPSLGAALAAELAAAEGPALASLQEYLAAVAAERVARLLRRGPPWSAADVDAALALQLVDRRRFRSEPAFRARALPVLLHSLPPTAVPELRDQLLYALVHVDELPFDLAEEVAAAWRAVPRRSAERREPEGAPAVRLGGDLERPLVASFYSLSDRYFDAAEVERLLVAVRRLAPSRRLVVIGDLPLRWRLGERLDGLGVDWIESYGRPYTPWPRDPLSLAWSAAGRLRVVVRPNRQPGREEDAYLGRQIVQGLPEELDRAWGPVTWRVAPVPFHNGQLLPTAEAVWVSIHTFEVQVLAALGVDRVPVASFATVEGVGRYVEAARRAAEALGELYRRPVRFVHPLPDGASPAASTALMERLGGGAGFDLDSLVTLLPGGEGEPAALVADLSLGRRLVSDAPAAELVAFGEGYDLELVGDELRRRLLAPATAREVRLQGFLDLVASHLGDEGLSVRRLPLLLVPTALLRDRRGVHHPDFLVGWNNVVVERRGGALRAEGFAALLPSGDRQAGEVFAAAGCRLDLLPTLVHSVVLNGGYRCASSHLRAAAGRPPDAPALH